METKHILQKIFGEIDTTEIERLVDETLGSVDGLLAEWLVRYNARRAERGEESLTMDAWIELSLPLGDARSNAVDRLWRERFIPEMGKLFGEDAQQLGNRKVNFGTGMIDDGLADLHSYLNVVAHDPDVEEKIAALKRQAADAGYKPGWVWHRAEERYGKLAAELLLAE